MLDELIGDFARGKSLTRRETEILFLLTQNITHLKEIAEHLKLSRSTINNHLNNIYIKTNVKGKAQLLAKCFGHVSEKMMSAKGGSSIPKVLVVNDREDPQRMLKGHLEEIGFVVLTTSNPIHVRGLLEKENIDLILSDMNMPDFDGFKLFKDVRIKYPKYPVFMYDRPYDKAAR